MRVRIVRQAANSGRYHSCIAAYNIGNEIPTDIIRWHGTARVGASSQSWETSSNKPIPEAWSLTRVILPLSISISHSSTS